MWIALHQGFQQEISDCTNSSASHVIDCLEALNLPEALWYMVTKGQTKDLHSLFDNFDIIFCLACGVFPPSQPVKKPEEGLSSALQCIQV